VVVVVSAAQLALAYSNLLLFQTWQAAHQQPVQKDFHPSDSLADKYHWDSLLVHFLHHLGRMDFLDGQQLLRPSPFFRNIFGIKRQCEQEHSANAPES
jgi:hypothetical protein